MENDPLSMETSGDIALSSKDREVQMGSRISQKKLKRVLELEELAIAAREDLVDEIRAGLKAESGELSIDSSIIRTGAQVERLVRPARARDGKAPRQFVISSREMRRLAAWCDGRASYDSDQVTRIVNTLIQRTWVVLRREFKDIREKGEFERLGSLVNREAQYHLYSTVLRSLLVLDRLGLLSMRRRISPIAGHFSMAFKRRTI
jgi:hypothetical protein